MSINPLFVSPEIPFLICKDCEYIVVGDHVNSHLQNQHAIQPKERRRIVKIVEGLEVTQTLSGLQLWKPPPWTADAITGLKAPRANCLRCNACGWAAARVSKMQEHCRREHSWENPRPRGGDTRQLAKTDFHPPWSTGANCQQLRPSGVGSTWFEVEHREAPLASGQNMQEGNDVYFTLSQRIKQRQSDQQILPLAFRVDIDPWLSRVGWASHLAGHSPSEWLVVSRPLQKDEGILQELDGGLVRVLDQARSITTESCIGWAALFELERKSAVGPKPPKPFDARMETDSWKRYKDAWRKVIWIIARFHLSHTDGYQPVTSILPPYTFTAQQALCWNAWFKGAKEAYEAGEDAAIGAESEVDRLVLPFLLSLLDQPLRTGSVHQNPLISSLAIMGIRRNATWMSALDYTPILSAIIKIARMLVALSAYEESSSSANHTAVAGEEPLSIWQLIQDRMLRFMVRVGTQPGSYPTPMDHILEIRSFGMRIRSTTPAEGVIHWDGNTLLCRHVRTTLAGVSEACHQILSEAEDLLLQITYTSSTAHLPEIPWDHIQDDHSNQQPGYNFLEEPRNEEWVQKGRDFLYSRIRSSDRLGRDWLDRRGVTREGISFRRGRARLFLAALTELRELLWAAMHLTSGQPARATEIMSVRVVNTLNGGTRNLLFSRGALMWVTLYHKGYRQANRTKVVHRFLPRPLAKLLIWYLWIILPFAQVITMVLEGDDEMQPNPLLWPDNLMLSMSVAVPSRQTCPDAASHPYKPWTTDRASRILSQISTRLLGTSITISSWRQIAIAFANRYLLGLQFGSPDQGGGSGDSDSSSDEDQGMDAAKAAVVKQSGHSVAIGTLIYARDISEGPFSSMARLDMFRQASTRWHMLLGFIDGEGPGLSRHLRAAKPETWSTERVQQREFRLRRIKSADWAAAVIRLLGPGSQLHTYQQDILRHIQDQFPRILCIAGTGTGKSMLFLLPAYLAPSGTTVVISPLVALQDDMIRRCDELGIHARLWRDTGSQPATIVFVSPESVGTVKFSEWINRRIGQQQLDRVVLDECHVVLDSTDTYRRKLKDIGPLIRSWGVPELYITASLSPDDEATFMSVMGMSKESFRVFRNPTCRANIRYRVRVYADTGKGMSSLIEQVEAELDDWDSKGSPGRVIIYAATIDVVRGISEALGCEVFFSSCGSHEEKRRRILAWSKATGPDEKTIVATSALGLGLDVADVSLVIHCWMPERIAAFVQESGRGGRGQAQADSVVLVREDKVGAEAYGRDGDKARLDQAGREYIRTKACRRAVLRAAMDKSPAGIACQRGEVACDNCERVSTEGEADTAEAGIGEAGYRLVSRAEQWARTKAERANFKDEQVFQRRKEEEAMTARAFESAIPLWEDFCFLCWTRGHGTAGCEAEGKSKERALLRGYMQEFRRNLFTKKRLAKFSCCYSCGLPQGICGKWSRSGKDKAGFYITGRCDKEDILEYVYGGLRLHYGERMDVIKQEAQEDGWEDIWGWLGQGRQWADIEANNVCWILFIIWQRCYIR